MHGARAKMGQRRVSLRLNEGAATHPGADQPPELLPVPGPEQPQDALHCPLGALEELGPEKKGARGYYLRGNNM